MSDLDNILSDEDLPEEETTEEAEAPEEETDEGQDETEQQDEPEADEPKAKEDEPEKSVPLAALQAERDEKRELKRRLEALESQYQQRNQPQQQQPPDIYEDPEARFQHERQQFQQELTARTLSQSRFYATREFGEDVVEATVEYFNQHPEQSHQFLNEPSPFHAAVEYYRKQRKLAEIGDDPEAYEAQLRERIRQEEQAKLVAENVKSAAGAKAPSLAGKSNLGSRQGGEWQGPSSLDDILAG